MSEIKGSPSTGALVLPFEQEEFGRFISGLLGKPQTLESLVRGRFEILARDVENTFHLVHQRVTQQNEANLVQFTVKIVYTDGSSVLVGSLQAFQAHVDVRPVVSEAVHLSWTYLIKFQDKASPEKQQIDLSFVAGGRHTIIAEGFPFAFAHELLSGHVFIRISHTARTWGVDLEALLTGHVKSLLKAENKLGKLICNQSGWIALASGVIFFVASVIYGFRLTARMIETQAATVQSALAGSPQDLQGLSRKVDMLIESISGSKWMAFSNLFSLQLVGSVILAVIFGIIVGSIADSTRRESFVLLSRKAEEKKEKADAKLRRRWLEFVFTFVLGVVGGVVSNLLFARLVAH